MKSKYILLIAILCLLNGCKKQNAGLKIKLNSKDKLDTLYISELITKKPITKINKDDKTKTIQLDAPTIASIHTKNEDKSYLTILTQNRNLNISSKPDSSLTTNDKSDSLINYLWRSNLDFIQKNSSFIFTTKNTDSILNIFENFRQDREKEINKFKEQFSPEVTEILYFQNDARIYSFLFWLGRISKRLPSNNNYFNFIEKIPKATKTLKSLPDIYLYKYEVEYLRKNQTLESIPDFLKFIEDKTKHKDLSDFLKANYIKALIEMPSYWEKHEKLFNTEVLTQTLNSEKTNLYYNLIEQTSSSFYASQNGEIAYLFKAEDKFGNQFNLESLIGKVIFIDTWATWCGPCINHRPKVLEFAKKYKNNNEVKILLVSVDSSKDKWLSFLDKENEEYGQNLFIQNGMRTEFGNNYNIKSIPRYILIGKDGKIINSNIKEPSLLIEKEIENALKE
ncbi:TlpA family protein disulfide reductase [Aestuariibaculum lutulentum]|uniref:TlpA family protein disulfide reductase n=1 Tax=Aestuariibaculum lutulentum TaxID=2920935 RepID=A0ABS9RMF1_9FLAO|nr:TlpA disulfide reductase family protein [Aestuariibaculum lutulentum]MCH4554124.1 TlpA family protein disulfide reductase [Aestuariibaculum lutulentum]